MVPEVDAQAGNDFPHDDSQPRPVVPDAQMQEDVGNVAGGVALRLVDVEEGWKEKLIVLHGHDAHSGAVFSLLLQRKGDIK